MAPALLRKLLSALAPAALREELLEDLDLGYRERLDARGFPSALGWGVRQLFSFDWFRLHRELREDLMSLFLQDGVRPADPLTFASVPLVLFATALAGSLIPALLATRVDPVTTLRSE